VSGFSETQNASSSGFDSMSFIPKCLAISQMGITTAKFGSNYNEFTAKKNMEKK